MVSLIVGSLTLRTWRPRPAGVVGREKPRWKLRQSGGGAEGVHVLQSLPADEIAKETGPWSRSRHSWRLMDAASGREISQVYMPNRRDPAVGKRRSVDSGRWTPRCRFLCCLRTTACSRC